MVHATAQLPPASFHHLVRDHDLYSSYFTTIVEDPFGFIWFGSLDGGGLYRFDGYALRHFQPDPTQLETTIAGPRIGELGLLSDQTLCIGTQSGFTLMDIVTGQLRNHNNQIDLLPDIRAGATWAFREDLKNNVCWIGTRYGLARYELGDSSFHDLRPRKAIDGAWPEDIVGILIDKRDSNLLWIASFMGLFSYQIDKGEYRYHRLPQQADTTAVLIDIFQDTAGVIWCATKEGFVVRYDPATRAVKSYAIPSADPAPNGRRDVLAMLAVSDREIWLSTYTSVGRINLVSGEYESWTYQESLPDGLLKNQIYRELHADRHGRLWVSSWHGIQYAKQAFLPKSHDVRDLRVAITDVDARPVYEAHPKPLLYSGQLSLNRAQRDVTFQFVLPNPLDPSAVSYQYKLEGYDRRWIDTDQRRARYPRLKGGSYRFLVRGREGNGEWLPETALDVRVEKQMTEYWWFWTGMAAFGIIAVVFISRLLIVRARKEEQLKAEFDHKLSEIQMQALRAQMNPHFLFNSLNSIKYFAISKSKDETAAYLSKFAMLVRAILNNSKSRTISLKDELDALRLYIEIEHLRLDGKFDYTMDIDGGLHIEQAQIPPMILQPFVENAIWHGLMHKEGKGRLLVQVKDLGSRIQCMIEDNGIGRARAAEIRQAQLDHKKSVGMQITSDRISLINKIYSIETQVQVIDLADADGRATGTRVVITIPLITDEEE